MKSGVIKSLLLSSCLPLCLLGQAAGPAVTTEPPPAAVGINPEWDTRNLLNRLAERAKLLPSMLTQAQPQIWAQSGASPVYQQQKQSAVLEVEYLVRSTDTLARQPEKLSAGLDALFRLQGLESVFISLSEGTRKYQNPDLAEQMVKAVGENAVDKDLLRQYVIDLAAAQEQERGVMDREAQRCREQLLAPPPRTAPTRRSLRR